MWDDYNKFLPPSICVKTCLLHTHTHTQKKNYYQLGTREASERLVLRLLFHICLFICVHIYHVHKIVLYITIQLV